MKNLLPIILILAGLGLGIYGIMKYGDSGASVEVLGVELSAKDNKGQQQAYLFMGLGLASLAGGIYLMKRK
jgi:LPXTG-motif cell wall-anchored protein